MLDTVHPELSIHMSGTFGSGKVIRFCGKNTPDLRHGLIACIIATGGWGKRLECQRVMM
jgi:hypothetical protein